VPSVRVIVTASYDDHRSHMLARRLGAAAMFDKPLDVDRLCAAIDGIAYAQSAISAGLRS
jgi:DNA-binding NarL/FixJ family response regulator